MTNGHIFLVFKFFFFVIFSPLNDLSLLKVSRMFQTNKVIKDVIKHLKRQKSIQTASQRSWPVQWRHETSTVPLVCLSVKGKTGTPSSNPAHFHTSKHQFLRKVWVCRIVCYRKLSDTGPQSVPPSNRVFQMLLDVPRSTLFEAYWVTSAATRIWSLTGGIGRFCLWNTRPSRGWANPLSPSFENSDEVTLWYQTFFIFFL